VTAVESNAALLAKAHTQALECGVTINSISAATVHKKVAQGGGVADLVTVMHGIHLVDYELALEECHRLLKPDGWLLDVGISYNLLASPYHGLLLGRSEQ